MSNLVWKKKENKQRATSTLRHRDKIATPKKLNTPCKNVCVLYLSMVFIILLRHYVLCGFPIEFQNRIKTIPQHKSSLYFLSSTFDSYQSVCIPTYKLKRQKEKYHVWRKVHSHRWQTIGLTNFVCMWFMFSKSTQSFIHSFIFKYYHREKNVHRACNLSGDTVRLCSFVHSDIPNISDIFIMNNTFALSNNRFIFI